MKTVKESLIKLCAHTDSLVFICEIIACNVINLNGQKSKTVNLLKRQSFLYLPQWILFASPFNFYNPVLCQKGLKHIKRPQTP